MRKGDNNHNSGALTQIEAHLYGGSRLGVLNLNSICTNLTITWPMVSSLVRGNKLFELSNQLGNVLVTISDKKLQHSTDGSTVDYYNPDVISATDYYSFGMLMPGRTFATTSYRYGFNGKEKDDEVKGPGNEIDYGMRVYDPRVGRFLSMDPLVDKYPWYSPYQYAGNKPIWCLDLDGLEDIPTSGGRNYSVASLQQWAYKDIIVQAAIKRGERVVLTQSYSVISNGQRNPINRSIVLNEGQVGSNIQNVNQDGNFFENGELGPSGVAMTFSAVGIYKPTPPAYFRSCPRHLRIHQTHPYLLT